MEWFLVAVILTSAVSVLSLLSGDWVKKAREEGKRLQETDPIDYSELLRRQEEHDAQARQRGRKTESSDTTLPEKPEQTVAADNPYRSPQVESDAPDRFTGRRGTITFGLLLAGWLIYRLFWWAFPDG